MNQEMSRVKIDGLTGELESDILPVGVDTEKVTQDIARELHIAMCSWNHVDGCGWFYSPDDWSEHSHAKYLKLAQGVVAGVVDHQASVKMLKIINQVSGRDKESVKMLKIINQISGRDKEIV